MEPVTTRSARDWAERQGRYGTALIESAIATSATLQAVLGRFYRDDPEGWAHAHRVSRFSIRIGEELNLESGALDTLERAAWLHDSYTVRPCM